MSVEPLFCVRAHVSPKNPQQCKVLRSSRMASLCLLKDVSDHDSRVGCAELNYVDAIDSCHSQ